MLTAAVCRSLGLQVGRTKVGESQLLFSHSGVMQNGLAWLSAMMLNPKEHYTALKPPSIFWKIQSLILLHVGKATSIPPCSNPKFLSVLSYLFILAFLESLLYGRTPCGGGFCQSPDKRRRSDTAVSEVCVWSLLDYCWKAVTLGWKLQSSLKDNVLLKTSSLSISRNTRGL